MVGGKYWSSTSVDDATAQTGIYFNDHRVAAGGKAAPANVRAVRGRPKRAIYATGCGGRGGYVDNGDGTVTDRCTKLMWQQDGSTLEPWCDALAFSEALSLGGYDDWRLPNARELESLADLSTFPQTMSAAITTAGDGVFWSSTFSGANNALAGFYLNDHRLAEHPKNLPHYITSVRGPE